MVNNSGIKPIILFFMLCMYVEQLIAQPEWTVVIYMEVADNLSDVALKSLNELASIGSNAHVNLYVQVHSFGTQAWRYRIEKNALILEEQIALTFDCQKDLTEALNWGFSHESSAYNMAILYGHGYGILEPWWNADITDWQCEFEIYQPDTVCTECLDHETHRAVLFHKEPRVFLTATGLSEALKSVQQNVLQGKKIDILGFDACMMAMVETSYQVAPYAHYLVGSQACELKDGWFYEPFLQLLAQGNKDPKKVVKSIVESYQNYYKTKAPESTYTQSAVDLSVIPAVRDSLNKIIVAIKSCYPRYGCQLISLLCRLRNKNAGFCYIPMYTDLSGFYVDLLNEVKKFDESPEKKELITQLKEGISTVEQAVIATCFGKNNIIAQGISVYFPLEKIDKTYHDSLFAGDSQWTSFLQWLKSHKH